MRRSWLSLITGYPATLRPGDPAPPDRGPSPLRPSVLLTLTLLLAGLLAFEAQRATRSHRVTAERALRDYAAVAAHELLVSNSEELDDLLAPALAPVVGSPGASPYDSLPAPSAIAGALELMPACAEGADAGRFVFSLDFRSGSVVTAGAPAPTALKDWLAQAVRPTDGLGAAWGAGPGRDRVALYRVKTIRYSGFAAHEAPLAAYGVVVCRSALARVLSRALPRRPLLPPSVTGGISNAALAALEVRGPDGSVLWRAGPAAGSEYAGAPAADSARGLTARAAFPPAVAARLALVEPRSRLPVLLLLLALTGGLGVVALRQLRREQELARLRADFTSSVSHELRTPLTQILLYAETLELGRLAGDDERRQALGVIVQEARRLAHLVENVLQYSRAERRGTLVHPERRSLAPLAREIVERFTPLAGTASVRLRTELDETVLAPVDADALTQILLNLLDNAFRHGGDTGAVVLRLGLHGTLARLEVEDGGPGVPAAMREQIWAPFVRIDRRPSAPGSGIGLAVVRELVRAHGGECRVEEAEGGGARFVVELPGAARAAMPSPTPPMEAPWPAS
ncbi:MAG TPA: HAMP domain-containing sensor histidine kinase [Gemmatimonadales bacterium]|nr:HAMP domain-containing sensor histidine kinase [Gemmatimonadales bacterium]